jgi:hypothetical protein
LRKPATRVERAKEVFMRGIDLRLAVDLLFRAWARFVLGSACASELPTFEDDANRLARGRRYAWRPEGSRHPEP